MPHLVLDRTRVSPHIPSSDERFGAFKGRDVAFAYALEGFETLAGLVFFFGSMCFLPQYAKQLDLFLLGCILFVIGSAMYLLVDAYALGESVWFNGWLHTETMENILYCLGSWLFVVGSILYWPSAAETESIESLKGLSLASYFNTFTVGFEGTIYFIIGSIFYACAAFINGLFQRGPDAVRNGFIVASTSLYFGGSVCYVIGSVSFLPGVISSCAGECAEHMEAFGAWNFIIGSLMFTLASSISIMRMYTTREPELERLLVEEEKP